MKRLHSLFLRYTLLSLLVMALLLTAVYFSTYYYTVRSARVNAESVLSAYGELLTSMIQETGSDALFLSSVTSLREYLDEGGNAKRHNAELDFEAFLDKKLDYFDQVRFLDVNGMEILRINNGGDATLIVPHNQLQDKGDRYYFTKTMEIPRGEVYVSRFDLNVEGGEVESPRKPMIRFATKAFNSSGQLRGIVVLNYLGSTLLNQLDWRSQELKGRLMLLNREGYWLRGRNPEEEWGFMYEKGQEKTLAKQRPEIWSILCDSESGSFLEHGSMHSFITIQPVLASQRTNASPDAPPLNQEEHAWKLLLLSPHDLLTKPSRGDVTLLASVFGVLLIPLLLLLWRVAEGRVRKAEHAKLEREQQELLKVQSLARAVAHEFRQPLAGLKLIADVTMMAEDNGLDPALAKSLGRVPELVGRVDTLVNQLLNITRFETLTYPGGREYVDLDKSSSSEVND